MFNMLFSHLDVAGLCSLDAGHTIVSFAAAPSLLLYSYIPTVVVAFLLGFLVFQANKGDPTARSFLLFVSFFSLWVLNIIVQWIGVPNKLLYISWQLTAFFEIGLFVSALYFFISFCTQKSLTSRKKILFLLFLLFTIILTFSRINVTSYDYPNCQGNIGPLWYIIYGFEVLVPFVIIIHGVTVSKLKENHHRKSEIILFSISLAVGLAIFSASNIVGQFLDSYSYNLFGPIGIIMFIGFVSYLILRYKIFDTKLFSSQILVIFLTASIASLLLIEHTAIVRIVTAFTFIFSVILGTFLIKSVRQEIEHREQLEKLRLRLEDSNIKLETANDRLKDLDKLKTEFLSLAAHQLRSPLTAIKGYTSMLIDGDFGKIGEKQKEAVDRVYQSSIHLSKVVEDLLNVSKIEAGGMQYTMAPFDMEKAASDLARDLAITAGKKGLKLTFDTDKQAPYTVKGDMEKIRQVVLNIIDNAIKYTEKGSISVLLKKDLVRNIIELDVTDTGMGIAPYEKEKLFQKFSRGAGGKTNTGGSGLGLYLAKTIAEAHGGRIAINSPGVGLGSTFTIELKAAADQLKA